MENLNLTNAYFREAMQTAINAREGLKKLETEKGQLAKNYTGDRLKTESDRINTQMRKLEADRKIAFNTLRENLTALLNTRKEAAQKRAAVSPLDGANLTPDFQLLNLPVVLTKDELQTLFDRHWHNPLFVRALQEYEAKHDIKIGADYSNPYDCAANTVNKVIDTAQKYLTGTGLDVSMALQMNPEITKKWDKQIQDALKSVDVKGATA